MTEQERPRTLLDEWMSQWTDIARSLEAEGFNGNDRRSQPARVIEVGRAIAVVREAGLNASEPPRTEAGRRDHDVAWDAEDEAASPLGNHDFDREGCDACEKIAAIEEAARTEATDDDRLKYHPITGDSDFAEASLSDRLDIIEQIARSKGIGEGYWEGAIKGRQQAVREIADTLTDHSDHLPITSDGENLRCSPDDAVLVAGLNAKPPENTSPKILGEDS